MSEPFVVQSQRAARAGVAALQRGDRGEAGLHFWHALDSLTGVQGLRARRDLLSEISSFFLGSGFEDLSLMAVLDALETDQLLGDETAHINDLITYANVQVRLGNLDQGERTYRSILESCLKREDYANAASASTNLAGVLAENGYTAEAVELLENSLGYLERAPFPDTELNTRFALVQLLELEQSQPERVLDAARALLARFPDGLAEPFHQVLLQTLDATVRRHLRGRTDSDEREFKAREFPTLYDA